MEWLQLLTSAVVGAVFGALASVATATRIARSGERGRAQEEARQRLLATVRVYRSAVAGQTGLLASTRSRPAENPLTEEAGVRFAERIERDLVVADHRLATRLREHLGVIIGPTDAAIARDVAFLPEEERHHQWKSDAYLRVNEQVELDRVLNKGLLGAARMYDAPHSAGERLVAELQQMEVTLRASGSSRVGRSRVVRTVVPKSVR